MERIKIASTSVDKCPLAKFYTEKISGLRIPTIQREFVWDPEDIKALLESIIRGYPIGAIIMWKPDVEFPSVPLMGKKEKDKKPIYILDGQQRITSLMLAMSGWKIKREDKEISTSPIRFVPESERFYIGEKKGIDVSLIVKAAMADSDALVNLQKNYPSTYKKAIDLVGSKIVTYELPLYILESNVTNKNKEEVYEGIAEIFTRVNSAGQPIGNLAMFLSFFAASFPREAKDAIIRIHKKYSETFVLDLEPIIRFVFSKMGMNQNQITKVKSFKPAIRELKEKYKGKHKQVLEIIDRTNESIAVILELLDKELGISSTQFVPSQIALLPLFEYAYNGEHKKISDFSQATRNKMMKWFLVTSFDAMYSTSANKRLEDDLGIIGSNKKFPDQELFKAMKERIRTNTIEREDVFYNFNVLRGRIGVEYLMLLDVLLYIRNSTDWAGMPIKSENSAIHHIFPRECLKENGFTDPKMINCLANLTLINPGINSEIGDELPEKYIPEYIKDLNVLEEHFIPNKKQLWKVDNFEDFLDARLDLIWRATKDLLNELT
jgi:hypothetical protein